MAISTSLSPAIGFGQANEEDVFELPDFRVTAERRGSYTATNSLTGTQLNTALRDSPFAIEVFTEAFMRDTGATNFREVLAYDSGLQLTNTIGTNQFGNYTLGIETDPRSINNAETDIVTRGFRAPTLKNGFFTQTRVDTVNVGRIERAAGPMSLLYGIGAITGVTNVLTKRPLSEFFTELEFMAGSDNLVRSSVDTTGPLYSDENTLVAYRVTAAAQRERTQFPGERERGLFISPALTVEWGRTTELRLEIEHGDRSRRGIGARDAADSRAGVPTVGTGVPSGRRDTGDNATFLQDFLGQGRFVNLAGTDVFRKERVTSYFAEINQRVGQNFRFLVSGHHEDYVDDRRFLAAGPSLLVNPADPAGASILYGFAETTDNRTTKQFRLSGLYSVEFLGGQQNIVVGRQELSEFTNNLAFPDSSTLLSGNLVQAVSADGTMLSYRGENMIPPSSYQERERWYQGHYVIFQGSFWDKRIQPVLGYRWDRTQTRFMEATYRPDGTRGPLRDPLVERGTVDGRDNGGIPFRVRTPTLGTSVTINRYLSAYALYSEGISLPNVAQRDGFGEGFPPELTKNREAGLKFDFFDGRLSGRFTVFNLRKTGGVRYSFYAPNPGRGNFNPNEPIIYEFGVNNPAQQATLISFLNFIGSTNPDGTPRIPADMERIVRSVPGGGEEIIFKVPFGDPASPGSFNPATGVSTGGYGADMLAFNRLQSDLAQQGLTTNSLSYLPGNNPSSDRGAYHNFDETSEGFEFRLQFTPIENWQHVLSYTRTEVTISSTFSQLAVNQIMTGLEPIFFALGYDNFTDTTNPNSYTGSLGAGVTNNDTPVHAFTYWTKYDFVDGPLTGFDLRLGLRYQSRRAAESPWGSPSGAFVNAPERGQGENTKAPVPAHTILDLGIGYTWEMRGAEWTLQLNVRNVLDKTTLTAFSENRLVEGLPIRTEFFLEPRDVRLSLRVTF